MISIVVIKVIIIIISKAMEHLDLITFIIHKM